MDRRHIGAGFWDFLIVIAVLATGAIVYRSFFMSKPAAVPPPAVVQNIPPPAPVVETPPPAPVPKPMPVVKISAPATSRPTLLIAPPLPPRPPETQIIERDLRVAQEAAAAAQTFIDRERKACLKRLHQSPQYLQARADREAKKAAKAAAASKLHDDDAAGADTDQDTKDLNSASTDWITAAAKLTAMENDAIASDSAVADKQAILASAQSDVAKYTGKLNDAVAKLVLKSADDADCPVRSVKLDTRNWTIETELVPNPQTVVSMMNDAAVIQIGKVLENVLCQSDFTWNTAKFTVFSEYHGEQVVEFQTRYIRSEVDKANFRQLDPGEIDDQGIINLADRVWLSPVVDDIQGGSPEMVAATEQRYGITAAPNTRVDVVFFGGYRRTDGVTRPLVFIRREHVDTTTSLTSIIPRRTPLPGPYSSTPMPGSIVNHLPDQMTPPQ